ncbi:hypothetical protein lerEdw1_000091 [Lerista edwardsae]|nr:hypothetical protein lerEdw1_000091 [Lerista edwardsae]
MEPKLVLLLSLVAVVTEVNAQSASLSPSYGIPMSPATGRNKTKLCGSILRNAILYSCVETRWKREAMDLTFLESIQTDSNNVLENVNLQSTSDLELKQPRDDSPVDKELPWTAFYKYYIIDKKNIPEIKKDPASSSEQKQVQRDHPPDTDFSDLSNDNKIHTGTEVGGQESPDAKGLANPTGSGFPEAKVKRKRDIEIEMAIKCCSEGCTARDVAATFCLN